LSAQVKEDKFIKLEAKVGEMHILVGTPEADNPLERPRCKWEENIKTVLRKWDENVCTIFIWLKVRFCDGFHNTVMNFRFA
jgi:hypothetical protein